MLCPGWMERGAGSGGEGAASQGRSLWGELQCAKGVDVRPVVGTAARAKAPREKGIWCICGAWLGWCEQWRGTREAGVMGGAPVSRWA